MSAIDSEPPAGKPIGNPTEGNIPKSAGPVEWDFPWTDYAVQQAQIAQKAVESTLENAIEVTRSRVDRILTTSSAHFNQTVDSLQDLKSDYITYEDFVFGKIKEGFLYASSRPLITTAAVLGVGFFGFKRTRQFLSYNTRRLFFSEETLLSRADAKVNDLRQSIDLLKAESEKLEIAKPLNQILASLVDQESGHQLDHHNLSSVELQRTYSIDAFEILILEP